MIPLEQVSQAELAIASSKQDIQGDTNLEVVIPSSDDSEMYQSFWKVFAYNIAGFLGFMYYGYVLVYVSCVPIEQQIIQYHISLDKSNATTLLSALLPVGGIVGSFLCIPLVPIISRRYLLLLISLVSVIGAGFIQIPNFACLIIGKLLQGICAGGQCSISPLFISEMSPKSLKGIMGNINLAALPIGIIMAQLLYYMMDIYNPISLIQVNQLYRIIFVFPVIFSILRFIILGLIYKTQTPIYFIIQQRTEQAKELISKLYHPEYVQNVYTMLKNDIQVAKKSQQSASKTTKLRIFIGVLLNLNQQFSGINVISLYGATLCQIAVPGYGNMFQILLMLVQMFGSLFSVVLIKRIGRRPLLHFGTIVVIITNIVTAIGYLPHFYTLNSVGVPTISTGQIVPLMIFLFIYMLIYGCTLGPITFSYVPEMTPARFVPIAIAANWLGAIITIVIFPIITNYISQAYLFFILTGLMIIGCILNFRFLIETKDKTEKEIEAELESKLL